MERVSIKTKDGVEIVGDFYGGNSIRGILLLHMMPATKESWKSFAEKLQLSGFKVLAVDLRGHGESTGGPEGYKEFSDTDHQNSYIDVNAAVEFLRSRGAGELNIAGASIGANLALWFAASNHSAAKIILLSPGLNYRGIKTEEFAGALDSGQKVYLAASESDVKAYGSAADTVRRLYGLANAQKTIKIFKGDAHGTDIFLSDPEFENELIDWLKKND